MKKGMKVSLGIFIPIVIIGAGLGGYKIYEVIHIVWIYGYHEDFFHGGIDYACNTSVYITASCNLRVLDIETWIFTDNPVLWQTKVKMK